MKHVKTLNTQTLNKTVKKAVAANVRHLASQHVRLPAQWEIRPANRKNNLKIICKYLRGSGLKGRCFSCITEECV